MAPGEWDEFQLRHCEMHLSFVAPPDKFPHVPGRSRAKLPLPPALAVCPEKMSRGVSIQASLVRLNCRNQAQQASHGLLLRMVSWERNRP